MRNFNYRQDRKLVNSDIPLNAECLRFYDPFDYEIDIRVLPQKIETIIFNAQYNKKINLNVLPYRLRLLIFGLHYNQKIDKDVLPDSLTGIHFGYEYNQQIDLDVLPPSLLSIHFGVSFNQPLMINGKSIFHQCEKLLYVRFDNRNINIDHKAFNYKTRVYIRYDIKETEITDYIHVLKIIDEILPMPIAEEIILHVEISYIRNSPKNKS